MLVKEKPLLTFSDMSVGYKKANIIHNINFSVKEGQKLGILGRNGVGKTTLMKGIIGILPISHGEIDFRETNITKKPAFIRSHLGIAYVPQGREIFGDLTVRENLEIGGMQYLKSAKHKTLNDQIEMVTTYFPELKQHMNRKGGVLSGGQQQQLSIARALMSEPKILLLDEPTDGIQPNVVESLAQTLNQIQAELKLTLILVEQNLNFAKKIIDDFLIIQKGDIVAQGSIDELTDDISNQYLSV